MVKVKKSITGVEVETDMPERIYSDVKREFTADEKEIIAVAGNTPGATESEIAAVTGKSRTKVHKTLKKAESQGKARKKNGGWVVDKKWAIAIVGIGAFLLIAMAVGGNVLGAKAQMGDVEAGASAVPLQQSPFSSGLGVGDIGAGRSVLFTPLQQSPFGKTASIGEVSGEQPIVLQQSPFSSPKSADIGDVVATDGAVAAPSIEQEGMTLLGTHKDFGNVYQQGDQLLIVGDDSAAIQQQMRYSEQGGMAGLINVKDVKQTSTYKNLSSDEQVWVDKYL